MSGKKGKHAAFTLVVAPNDVRARRRMAPAGRVMDDARRRAPRRRPDYLAEMDDAAGRAAAEE